jgi:large subunit ribosomal protein L33
MREAVTLECPECKRQNYRTSRDKSSGKKLQLKKYCPRCRKHTVHREKK